MSHIDVRSPFDGRVVGQVELLSEEGALAALSRAHDLYRARERWTAKAERLAILERLASAIEARVEPLARQAASEGGKPLVDSRVELERAVAGVRAAARELAMDGGHEVPMGLDARSGGRLAFTHREPRGPVMAISAFNHPFNLVVHQVVPAIAVGCPVLVKPAKATPLSCQALVALAHEAGAPPDLCQLAVVENAVASRLVADRRTAFLTFIGSAAVGWKLRSLLAPGADCALEHGGAAPAVVDQSADLADAVTLLVKAGYYHAGQVCVSTQRIYVHQAVADEFAARFVEAVRRLRVGDPLDEATEVGPLINAAEADRVAEWVDEAAAGGARVLVGGQRLGPTLYAPTVLFAPTDEARVSREEIFGPVVAIYPVADLDEAVRRANATDYFFQASVFTRDLDQALALSRRLDGMAVMVNDHTAFRVDWMPFGGHRASGLHAGGIGPTMRHMTVERMVVIRSRAL